MIALAKGFMVLGAVAGIIAIGLGLLLLLAWANDRWQRRNAERAERLSRVFQPEEHTGHFTTPLCLGFATNNAREPGTNTGPRARGNGACIKSPIQNPK